MISYLINRLALSVIVVFGVSILVFSMIHLVPGDPAVIMLSEQASGQDVQQLRHDLGLDQPLWVQYSFYIGHVLHGDLGRSIRLQRPVAELIGGRLPNTLQLAITSLSLATLIGVVVGTISAVRRGRTSDHLVMVGALLGVSLPSFWLGLLLILFFGLRLGVLPIAGNQDGLVSLVLPAVTLAAVPAATIARLTRSGLLDVLGEDYIRTARAKGLKEVTVIVNHALRNSMIPVITVVGVQFGVLLGGAVIVETVFAWPGVGRLLIDAVSARDFPLVQGIMLFISISFVLVNLLADVVYAYVDPRIRYA
jgi:ABC-type dipeptide/oligopeptide/nickel transport system permease component